MKVENTGMFPKTGGKAYLHCSHLPGWFLQTVQSLGKKN